METAGQNRRRITGLVLVFGLALLGLSLAVSSPAEIIRGEWQILTSRSILVTDYIALGGLGAAFFNAGLVSLMGLAAAWLVKARFNGYLLAALFTLAGFGFFGNNPFNILPTMLGVYLYETLFSHKPMRDLIAPLLFGTTLGPVVSQTVFGFGSGVGWLALGLALGILAGMLLAALMNHIYSFHMGYNLYNTGTTGGFVATVVYMMMRGFGLEITPVFYWSTEYTGLLTLGLVVFLAAVIALGFAWGGNFSEYRQIIKSWGRLPSDYVAGSSLGTTLVNMGVVGLLALGYVRLVAGDVNGATIAGILTVFGFGALGKHPRNVLPIMIGVYLICLPKIWEPNDPGPLLAALFCTTLAPLAGRFGFLVGILAGAIHLPMAMHVGSLHGFMNLYNNGFAGGLAMLIIVGFIKGLRPHWLEDPLS
ncbi:MAG: DUF1576 domain-containing protein [Anaerolineae bacterium]|nr:DUF1576 domain-containing protein [Anaerolineae bacterium]